MAAPKKRSEREHRRKSSLAFPIPPRTERGGFIKFIEESGAADIFFEMFSQLYVAHEKPEDPIRWLHEYLRTKAPARQVELDSMIETLQHDILQAANEIEDIKGILRQKEAEPVQARKIKMDEDFIREGNDERWLLKPDPLFRPDPRKTKHEHIDATCTVPADEDVPTFGIRESFKSLCLDKEPSINEEDEDIEAHEEEEEESDHYEPVPGRSTETSPQLSEHSISPHEESSKDKVLKIPESSMKFGIKDPAYYEQCIPSSFWTEDFSLDKKEEESEEEDEVNGKPYKFKILEESSWLPERDIIHLHPSLNLERSREEIQPSVDGSMTLTNSTTSQSKSVRIAQEQVK